MLVELEGWLMLEPLSVAAAAAVLKDGLPNRGGFCSNALIPGKFWPNDGAVPVAEGNGVGEALLFEDTLVL